MPDRKDILLAAMFEKRTSRYSNHDIKAIHQVLDRVQDTFKTSNSVSLKDIEIIFQDWENNHRLKANLRLARRAGYVQGVCECAVAVSADKALSRKLLSAMGVTRAQAQKFARPETFADLESSVFARKQGQALEEKPRPAKTRGKGRHL